MPRLSRRLLKGVLALLVVLTALFFLPPLPRELRQLQASSPTLRLLDRSGRPLRVVAADGEQRVCRLDRVSPYLTGATLAAEDHRFFQHPGLDPKGIVRAAYRNWQSGGTLQGGSTLTQQLVRLLRRAPRRDWSTKLLESYWALRLERSFTKSQILEAYLSLAPYGMQTVGCEAAAQLYFAKPAAQLSLAEATFLAVLPRAPESFLPYQNLEEVTLYQRRLLQRMQQLGSITADEHVRAARESVRLQPVDSSWEAGHFCDYVLPRLGARATGDVRTTLDLALQHEVEGILAVHLKRLHGRGVTNGAVVVLDVATGGVLAMVGSGDYATGQFNAALAGRQAGSTLKPFTYGLALERGFTAASILPDLNLYPKQTENGYIPHNYDERFHGPVRLREALACSYNVPPVRVLERLGTESLLQRLRALGFTRLTQSAKHYGLGLTLGAGEVSLLELARAYRCLARRGRYSEERALASEPEPTERMLMDPAAAAILTDILRDKHARAPAFGMSGPLSFPFDCAVKTGTTKGYRDNWTVGYTPIYVVAVWVGNFDGTSMRGAVSGVTGAAPIFHDVMNELVQRDGGSPPFTDPDSVRRLEICEASGELPGPHCSHRRMEKFDARHLPGKACAMHREVVLDRRTGTLAGPGVALQYQQRKVFTCYPPLFRAWALEQGIPQPPPGLTPSARSQVAIAFPDNGAVFRLEDELPTRFQQLHLRATVPDWCEKVEWRVGNETLHTARRPFDHWWKLRRGGYMVKAVAFGSGGRREESRAIRVLVR
jgi:penicillin-binding protein 1C